MVDLHIDKISIQALPENMAQKIDDMFAIVMQIVGRVNLMADTADQILEGVGRMRTKVESLEALTDKLFGLYQELRQDPAKLQEVLDTVAEIETGADAAVTRNTPAADSGDTGGDTGGSTPPDNPTTDVTSGATPGGGDSPADVKV